MKGLFNINYKMWPLADKNKFLRELVKVQDKREMLLNSVIVQEHKEKYLMNWLTRIEGTLICTGDRAYIENNTKHPESLNGSHRTAAVRYTSVTIK